ncbi:BMP family ABC transporter substrate-binding protein [Bacillus shivajii]|uniref:BMP family ABC transporter substrate-binding protein n=1 Tax=Bacillus shivajii TaxID=1983719 RepID=UPI001CFBB5B7|nr:BMP family ABC transporter substrate-binding protein [Bacillus shivajii]UCZ52758.1 BMP family ABC transporter substrate-binding protein [Bacillus shivajii]
MQQSKQSKQTYMILLFATLVAVVFILLIIVRTNGILYEASNIEADQDHVVILTSDKIIDQSWGSLAYKGSLKIEDEFPASVSLFSEVNTEQLMKETVLEEMSNDPSLVIGHGREFSEVFTELAASYPDVHFVTIRGTGVHANQTVYTLDKLDSDYFAALVATMKSDTKKIGIIDAIDIRDDKPEFAAGLNRYAPEAELHYRFVGSRDDGETAVKQMDELLKEGVDVIYPRGNAYNRDVIKYAKDKGVYVIGFLDDQSYLAEDIVLTSVIGDVPQVYVVIMEDFYSEEGMPAGEIVLNESHGVNRLAPLGPMFDEEEKDRVKKEINKYRQGEISFD